MSQGLKGEPYTYTQFSDLVFGLLLVNDEGVKRILTLIGNYSDYIF